jgi:hypothetical protein
MFPRRSAWIRHRQRRITPPFGPHEDRPVHQERMGERLIDELFPYPIQVEEPEFLLSRSILG